MWRLFSYDVWGNPETGFNCNHVYRTGTTFSRRKDALAYAKVCGAIEDRNAEGGNDVIFIIGGRGEPVAEFRREKAQKKVRLTPSMRQAMESDEGC